MAFASLTIDLNARLANIERDMGRAAWDALPGYVPQLQPTPTPLPPAIAVPRFVAPVGGGCANGRCTLAW